MATNISYNHFANLTTDHIHWKNTLAIYTQNKDNLPKTFFDIATLIQNVRQNQCVVLDDELKNGSCILKTTDGESLYPLFLLLPNLVAGTAQKIIDDLQIAVSKKELDSSIFDKELLTLESLKLGVEKSKKDIKIFNEFSTVFKHVLLCAKVFAEDHYRHFIETHIKKKDNIYQDCLDINDYSDIYILDFSTIFDEFKDYCIRSNKGKYLMKREFLQKAIEKKYGKGKKTRNNKIAWYGLDLIKVSDNLS